jgi:hypothetical protein
MKTVILGLTLKNSFKLFIGKQKGNKAFYLRKALELDGFSSKRIPFFL